MVNDLPLFWLLSVTLWLVTAWLTPNELDSIDDLASFLSLVCKLHYRCRFSERFQFNARGKITS